MIPPLICTMFLHGFSCSLVFFGVFVGQEHIRAGALREGGPEAQLDDHQHPWGSEVIHAADLIKPFPTGLQSHSLAVLQSFKAPEAGGQVGAG